MVGTIVKTSMRIEIYLNGENTGIVIPKDAQVRIDDIKNGVYRISTLENSIVFCWVTPNKLKLENPIKSQKAHTSSVRQVTGWSGKPKSMSEEQYQSLLNSPGAWYTNTADRDKRPAHIPAVKKWVNIYTGDTANDDELPFKSEKIPEKNT